MKQLLALLCALLLLFSLGACNQSKAEHTPPYTGFRPIGDETLMMNPDDWGELNVHDPSILKENGIYYAFSTDASYGDVHSPGIQIRTSPDMVTWKHIGTAFADFETDCAPVIQATGCTGLWAPAVIKVGNTFRLYFSASTFGSSSSCIGLAEAKRPEGPYTYQGIVYQSYANAFQSPNAIDPAIIADRKGQQYITFGSFFGGIVITPLNNATGFLKDPEDELIKIAGHPGAPIEAPVILYAKETDYYYLFVSYGSLSSDYNIRVGRAREVTGPYLDANGSDLRLFAGSNAESVGTKLVGGYQFVSEPGTPLTKGFMAPGHNDAFTDGKDYYIAHHTRTYTLPDYWFTMNIRKFFFNEAGWPVVLPCRYHGENTQPCTLPDGEYALVAHGRDSNAEAHRSKTYHFSNGKVTGPFSGHYECYEDYGFSLTLEGTHYEGVVQPQYDAEREMEVIAFSVMSQDGSCLWGYTQP